MFSVADLDTNDDTIEVIASQFFGKCLSLHSITIGSKPHISFRRIIDDTSGTLFSSILADFDTNENHSSSPIVIDSGSTVPTLKHGDSFSHVLVTSHESKFSNWLPNGKKRDGIRTSSSVTSINDGHSNKLHHETDGGSLFAFRIPKENWKTGKWTKQVIATGFHVKGQLSNMINPGAPGFCYTLYPTLNTKNKKQRPLIAVSGDCAESAYIFRPATSNHHDDPSTYYKLMCEIDIEATVGSLAIGYSNFCDVEGQSDGSAKIFIPAYEKNKILVFSMEDKIEF